MIIVLALLMWYCRHDGDCCGNKKGQRRKGCCCCGSSSRDPDDSDMYVPSAPTRVTRDNRTRSPFLNDVLHSFYLLVFCFYLIYLCCSLSEITTGPEGKQPLEYADLKEESE